MFEITYLVGTQTDTVFSFTDKKRFFTVPDFGVLEFVILKIFLQVTKSGNFLSCPLIGCWATGRANQRKTITNKLKSRTLGVLRICTS